MSRPTVWAAAMFLAFAAALVFSGPSRPPESCAELRDRGSSAALERLGAVHHYPLTVDTVIGGKVCDGVGTADGTVTGDVRFDMDGAAFDGASSILLPDRDSFSAATTGALTVAAVLSVDDWSGGSPHKGYVHWMGKGARGAQEWAFRHYTDEASDRRGRVSFYAFSPEGGLGAGSYFPGPLDDRTMLVAGTVTGSAADGGTTSIWLDGDLVDRDRLSRYGVVPQNTGSPVTLGTRSDRTGYLIGTLRDVVFFDRALLPAEMERVYRALDR